MVGEENVSVDSPSKLIFVGEERKREGKIKFCKIKGILPAFSVLIKRFLDCISPG